MGNPVREFFSGAGTLLRGFSLIIRRPKLFALGALPPLVTSILFLVVLIALLMNIDALTTWMTPFADGWGEWGQNSVRIALGVSLVAGSVLLMVIAFTGATLLLGSPLYDKISEYTEEELGHAPPEVPNPLMGQAVRAVRQTLALLLVSLLVAIPLFAAGFIPIVGQTVVPVVSAMFGGWMLCIELVGAAFDRRGLRTLRDRRRHMKLHRARVFGFAVPVFLLLAIPGVAIVAFPAAAAGGTILSRHLIPQAPLAGAPGYPAVQY